MPYDAEKIRKLVRMLSGEHDGEVANAARMLVGHAKKEGHDLDQMLAEVYSAKKAPKMRFFEDAYSAPNAPWGQNTAQAAGAQASYAAAQAAAAQAAYDDFWARNNVNPFAQPRQSTQTASKLARFQDFVHTNGIDGFTPWEVEFAESMMKKSSFATLTPKQEEVIDRILQKYA